MYNTPLRIEMAGGSGAPTTEEFIFRAQKSTNHLKALLAKLLPASGGGYGTGAESSDTGSAVDALLSDITDSLSQAITSLRIPTAGQPVAASTGASRSPAAAGAGAGGGRSAAPRRTSHRARMDGASRMTVLQNGVVHDSYKWRKYGQKEILGARFPRSYYKCGGRLGCPAKKHVQQWDADPSKLEITYFEAHTCDDPPPRPSSSHPVADPTTGSDALLVPVSAVPFPSAQCYVGQPSSSSALHQVPYAAATIGSNALTRAADLLLPVAAVPGALPTSASYDDGPAVPDVMDSTPLWELEQEQAHDLLHIPSPACSQSELLPVEAANAKLSPIGLALSVEHTLDCEFAVPEI